MAKKAAKPTEEPQAVSKMATIKQLLAKGLSNPTEIATQAKEQFGLDVKPGYVSTVKTQLKAKPAKKSKSDNLDAAVEFCEGVGGVDAAKSLLETIERIKKL